MIWLASAVAAPSSTRKTTARARTGTPRATATSGSTEASSSGRPMHASTLSASAPTTASTVIWAVVIPRKLPNSRELTPPRKPL